MRRARHSEADIAATVVAYLESCGHDVYQEVPVSTGIADIVALVAPHQEVWIVEVKASCSLDLIEQCMGRRVEAHRVFAAIPKARRGDLHERIFAAVGVGVLSVDHAGELDAYWPRVTVAKMAPRVSRDPRFAAKTRAACKPGHKTHAKAGSPGGGGRFTPFRATCEEIARVTREHPGILLKDAIGLVSHHYRTPGTARSSIAKWAGLGKVPGVELRVEGGKAWLYPRAA